ncbi:hypothetical protein CDAR_602231 [Caerostris darwini]|uniref:Uncharacterized protein n=1 Tax=Caerostris darwini TaxID=1538125 RepID=A0AAV4N966_9ARAC|nr:hypothetical protein CDAR_602231 [Caerostris darwini]
MISSHTKDRKRKLCTKDFPFFCREKREQYFKSPTVYVIVFYCYHRSTKGHHQSSAIKGDIRKKERSSSRKKTLQDCEEKKRTEWKQRLFDGGGDGEGVSIEYQ